MLKLARTSLYVLLICLVFPWTGTCQAMTQEEAKKAYQELGCEVTGWTDLGRPTCVICNDLTQLVANYDASWDVVPELTTITADINLTTPNNGVLYTDATGPTASVTISGMKPGTYTLSVYGTGPNASSDSVYYGVSNVLMRAITLDVWISPGPKWSSKLQGGGTATIEILDNGPYLINLWAREDGASITQIKLDIQ